MVISGDLPNGDSAPQPHDGPKGFLLGGQEIQKYEAEIKDLKIEKSKKEKQI